MKPQCTFHFLHQYWLDILCVWVSLSFCFKASYYFLFTPPFLTKKQVLPLSRDSFHCITICYDVDVLSSGIFLKKTPQKFIIFFPGNESSILNCKQRWQRYPYCSRRNILSVQCSGPDTSNHCVKECAIKKNYYVTDNNVCSVCSTSCLRCEKNATRCTACREGLQILF